MTPTEKKKWREQARFYMVTAQAYRLNRGYSQRRPGLGYGLSAKADQLDDCSMYVSKVTFWANAHTPRDIHVNDPLNHRFSGFGNTESIQAYLDQTSDFFDKHGNMALVLGRFVPFVRTYVTLVAGVTRLPRRRFWLWSVVGAVLWVAIVMLAGYFLGAAFPTLGENIDKAMIVILAFSIIPIGYEWWRNRHSHGHARDRTDEAQAPSQGASKPDAPADAPADRT